MREIPQPNKRVPIVLRDEFNARLMHISAAVMARAGRSVSRSEIIDHLISTAKDKDVIAAIANGAE
jgi:ABC-type ATPase with predicted acetyltransferase domain